MSISPNRFYDSIGQFVPPAALSEILALERLPLHTASYVYFLCQGEEVVYVGKTTNLFYRIGTHAQQKEFDAVYFMEVPEPDLDRVEQEYIQQLKPKLNDVIPGGKHYCSTATPNMVRSVHSGTYFLRATVGGKKVFKSLKTKSSTLAQVRLGLLLSKKRQEVENRRTA